MKGTYLSIFLGLFNLFIMNSQSQSSCRGVFYYESDGSSVYGVIRLQPIGPVVSVLTKANFTVATRIPSTLSGSIEPFGNDQLLFQQFNQGFPITYRVHFSVTSPLPRVTSITVNDIVICYASGDIPRPNEYVTTISLQHMLFQKPGTPGSGFNQEPSYTQQQTQPPSVQQPQTQPAPQTGYPPTPPNQPPNRFPNYPEQTTEAAPLPAPSKLPSTELPLSTNRPQAQLQADMRCGIVSGGNDRVPLIFSGQSFSRGDWPWLVAIYRRKEGSLTFNCGGTLVSNRHVVSAAHCLQQKNTYSSIKDIVVKVGVHDLEDWGDDITVTRTLASASIHESYNASTLENDILVFTLERSVEFSTNIRPACLWNGNADQSRIIGATGVVAGWGRNELGQGGQGEPLMVRIPIVSTSTCRASNAKFHSLTSERTLCAGDRKGSGPCLGDSGGGLYLIEDGRWRIRGVVSISLRPPSGETTCDLNEYVVFTDTAQYNNWIKDAMAATASLDSYSQLTDV